ncbi:hypothetical protein ABVT39_003772 [Epinephelus coioides]
MSLILKIMSLSPQASYEDEYCRTCPDGWTLFDIRCHQFHQTPKTWADAEHFCTTLGGNLASLHTQDGYEVLRNWILRTTGTHTNAWVGGYDSSAEGVWLNSDGSLFDFKGWAKGEPNNVGGNEHCMEINFEDEYCRTCPDGWTPFGKKCYQFHHAPKTWADAEEGVWLNSDGSLFDFKGWAKGEPSNSGGKEHCMEINFEGKDFINDTPCNQKKSFACARDL